MNNAALTKHHQRYRSPPRGTRQSPGLETGDRLAHRPGGCSARAVPPQADDRGREIAEERKEAAPATKPAEAQLLAHRAKVQQIIDNLSEYLLAIPWEIRGEKIQNDQAARGIASMPSTPTWPRSKSSTRRSRQRRRPKRPKDAKEEQMNLLRKLRSFGGKADAYKQLRALPKPELDAIRQAASMNRASVRELEKYAHRLWENTGRMAA
jgi:hypothetical protein